MTQLQEDSSIAEQSAMYAQQSMPIMQGMPPVGFGGQPMFRPPPRAGP
eukprot:gene41582-55126_t